LAKPLRVLPYGCYYDNGGKKKINENLAAIYTSEFTWRQFPPEYVSEPEADAVE
jgi:hypothetical protein